MLGCTIGVSGGGYTLRCGNIYTSGSAVHTTYACTFSINAQGVWTLTELSYIPHTPSGNHGNKTVLGVGRIVKLL